MQCDMVCHFCLRIPLLGADKGSRKANNYFRDPLILRHTHTLAIWRNSCIPPIARWLREFTLGQDLMFPFVTTSAAESGPIPRLIWNPTTAPNFAENPFGKRRLRVVLFLQGVGGKRSPRHFLASYLQIGYPMARPDQSP